MHPLRHNRHINCGYCVAGAEILINLCVYGLATVGKRRLRPVRRCASPGRYKHVATVTAFVSVGFSLDGGEIDPELTKIYRGTVSLRFKPGKRSRVAVKMVDDRGIESLKVVEVRSWRDNGST